MDFLNLYWNGLLNVPLGWVVQYLGVDMMGWKTVAFRIACTIGILMFFYEIYLRFKEYRRRSSYNRELKAYGKLGGSGLSGEEHKAVKDNPEGIIGRLKKEGSHEKLAEVFATLGRHKEAAKAWKRGGRKKVHRPTEMGEAGYPLKAARLFYSAGEYEAAGKLYLEKKSYKSAAKSFKLSKSYARAADSFHLAGRYADSLAAFEAYFATPGAEDATSQMAGADASPNTYEDPKVQAALPKDKLRMLCVHCGRKMQGIERRRLAKLFGEGELVMAGEAYLLAGQLEAAARCMNQAGETKRASEIGGRYYESLGKWKEAGMAYEGGGEFGKARRLLLQGKRTPSRGNKLRAGP